MPSNGVCFRYNLLTAPYHARNPARQVRCAGAVGAVPFRTEPPAREAIVSSSEPAPPSDPSPAPTVPTSAEEHLPFPIVGVGASAGGLEAFTELLGGLPSSPGIAFLFVQHLEPRHKSQLPEILTRVTSLPIREAVHGMAVQADHVYLIPPNANMALVDGHLGLTPRQRGPHMPADYLFRSLAGILKTRAIGVILSGGGTDGTLGFQSIKAEGGITFAQDEKSARQDSMPRSAILEGCVDYVLPPLEIARQLVRVTRHPYAQPVSPATEAPAAAGDTIGQVIGLLRGSTDVDFTHYKRTTI